MALLKPVLKQSQETDPTAYHHAATDERRAMISALRKLALAPLAVEREAVRRTDSMTDERESEPPKVVIDDDGIGAWLGGVCEYHIHWSDIRRIEVDVVSYGDLGAEAFWAIHGAHRVPGSPALFAPVELVAGGDDLTERLRSMPGFNDEAFKQACAAEKRGEAGTFGCWESA